MRVSIDGRNSVSLLTDSQGYLYLYLPVGQHTVKATDTNGINYIKTLIGASTNDSDMKDNEAGTMESEVLATTIITPYIDSEIHYSFDSVTWGNATTNALGGFTTSIPGTSTKIYIKRISTGEIQYAEINDGIVGLFISGEPLIISQTESSITFSKGSQGLLYV